MKTNNIGNEADVKFLHLKPIFLASYAKQKAVHKTFKKANF